MTDRKIDPHAANVARREAGFSRRRFLRVSTGGLAGVAAMSVLSACGQAQPAAPTAAPAQPTTAAKPAPAGSPAAGTKPAPASSPAAKAGPGGFAGGGSLTLLVRSHFVPGYDQWLDQFAADWGTKNNVDVTVDHIVAGELPTKWAAEIASRSGHDLIGFTQGGAISRFNAQLVDVSALAKEIGQAHGGWVEPLAENVGQFEDKWKGIPDYFIDFPGTYRKDLFDANGLKPVDTYADLLKAGELLKSKQHPIGLAINQRSNDANNSWISMMWGFGASFVGKDGKTVTLDSPETNEMVTFAVELYRKTMTDEVLSWDDSANNQALASGRLSWIQNPISALRTIEKQDPELAEKIYISNAPAGPAGRFASVSTGTWGIWDWSPNAEAAKAFLREYFTNMPAILRAAEGYNQPLLKEFRKKPMPVIGEDPKLQVLQDFAEVARTSGYPGPPTPASAEVEANWIIPLMIGRAIQGGGPEAAIEHATGQVEAIYAKYK